MSAGEDHDGGGGYGISLVLGAAITIVVAVFAGPFWHYLLGVFALASLVGAIVLGYVRLRRNRSRPSDTMSSPW